MRTIITGIAFLAICFTGFSASSQTSPTQQRKIVRYYERINNTPTSFNNQGLPNKPDRLSSSGGQIVLNYNESLPDSIKISMEAAKKLWEAKISTNQPIYIDVVFESLGEELSMISEVSYCETQNYMGLPMSLAVQLSPSSAPRYSPDGVICLNSDIKWNCRFSKDAISEYNLPTSVLRGIARCLGFGTSLYSDENKLYYTSISPTCFDKLLHSNNVQMESLTSGSEELVDFATSGNVYANTGLHNYKIHAPENFVEGVSLCYFDDSNSLMSRYIGKGCVDLFLDSKTTDVLGAIGWDLPRSGFSIKCNDISENGIGSSYISHTFFLDNDNSGVSNCHWRFLLKNVRGEDVLICSNVADTFTIPAISMKDDYFVNLNGDLEGRIECDYTVGGESCSASPFNVSLELKPAIHDIYNITVSNSNPYDFIVNFNVRYAGADHVTVEVEEEYSTTLRSYRFDEPYIAHVKTGNISNLSYSWITVEVSNQYGSAYEYLEFAPSYGVNNSANLSCGISSDLMPNQQLECIVLYDLNGRPVYEGTEVGLTGKNFESGLYIKKEYYSNGDSKTSKILF